MPKRRSYDEAPASAIVATLNLINGCWKGVVLYYLTVNGTIRFNELHRHLPGARRDY
jgi:DNA-binding HxlR family transcriptional regulator